MIITYFFPIFAILLIASFRSPRLWFIATVVGSIFQAASPVILVAGGRYIGFNSAYIIMWVGVFHLLKSSNSIIGPFTARLPPAFWLFVGFTVYSVIGAIILPRLFLGEAMIMPPRFGLDVGFVEPLRPSSGNYVQSIYVVFNFVLVTIVYSMMRVGKLNLSDCAFALKVAAIVISVIGFYQVVGHYFGLAWPYEVVNSNIGVGQSPDQTVFGVKRMSSTFQEPSMMAMHLLGVVVFLIVSGYSLFWMVVGLIALLISTSSIAYAGLAAVLLVLVILSIAKGRMGMLASVIGIFFLASVFVATDYVVNGGEVLQRVVLSKLDSGSGEARIYSDKVALTNVMDTLGLGVGVGSTRASSFFTTLLATTGLVGVVLLVAAIIFAIRGAFSSGPLQERPILVGLTFSLMALFLGLALGIPDFAMPLVWVVLGVVIALESLSTQVREKGG
ncbi:MAG: hypothetical protein II007_05620 [Gammaproteobacteria bacterium]|nr:hypothetical protein [Gammaproteobacteria bacterium]